MAEEKVAEEMVAVVEALWWVAEGRVAAGKMAVRKVVKGKVVVGCDPRDGGRGERLREFSGRKYV